MFKVALIFLFLAASVMAKASPVPTFSSEDIRDMDTSELQPLYRSYIDFFDQIERDLYELGPPSKKKTTGIQNLSRAFEEFFIPSAHAQSKGSLTKDGQVCFFGGHESHITNGYCVHPRFIENANYTSCPEEQFRCRPELFQKNTCIEIKSYEHLTDKCYQRGKLEPKQLKERLSRPFFQELQEKVNAFCDRNPPYDACDSLRSVLQDYKSAAREENADGAAGDSSVPSSESSQTTSKEGGHPGVGNAPGLIPNDENEKDEGVELPQPQIEPEPKVAQPKIEPEPKVARPKIEPEPKVARPQVEPASAAGSDPKVARPQITPEQERVEHSSDPSPRKEEKVDISQLPTGDDISWRRSDPTLKNNKGKGEKDTSQEVKEEEVRVPPPEILPEKGRSDEEAYLDQRGVLKGRVFNCHSNLMVRRKPTEQSGWHGRLSCPKSESGKGAKVDIVDVLDNGWLKINYNGKEAYVSGKYVKLNHAVDFAHEALTKMKKLNLSGDLETSRCMVGGVRKEDCEHDDEKEGRKPSQVDENFMNSCTGRSDPPQTRMGSESGVEKPQDYILSRAYETRDINGAGENTDSTCSMTDWNRVEEFLGIPSGEKISIQDYIDYRCTLMKPGSSCRNANFGKMKRNYEGSLQNLPQDVRSELPSGDELVGYLGDLKFADNEGNEVKIPRSLSMAMMYKESRGKIGANREGDDHGLFQINSDFHQVKKDNEGVVLGSYDSPPDARTYNRSASRVDEESSIYHPFSNTDKFVDIMRAKWNRLQDFFDGREGRPDFRELSSEKQWQFVLASYNGGENNIFTPFKRLKKFNKALKCNSCEAFSPQHGSCQALRLNCKERQANSCGDPLPVTFETIERFNNFTGHRGDADFDKNMKCFAGQHMGRDQKGPCNVGVTFTYTRGMDSLQSCFEYEEGN